MKIKIICAGKLKEKYLKDAVSEYSKRISRFAKLEVFEIADEKIPDNASYAEIERTKNAEGERILNHISDKDFVISLCIEGKMLTSEDFAEKIEKITLSGKNSIAFIIGGSVGIADFVKNSSDFCLSFSKMTFPHQLMRVILLEQIYRSFKINANESYHK